MKNIIYDAQYGNQQAIEQIIKLNQNLIISVIRKYNFYVSTGEIDDLIQEGNIGLIKAIKYFDSEKNIEFKSFARLCIKCRIIEYIQSQNKGIHKILTNAVNFYTDSFIDDYIIYFEQVGINYNTPESIFLKKEELKYIFNKINQLQFSDLENNIFMLLSKEYTYSDIIKLSKEKPKKIDNTIQRIRNKIKKVINE